MCVHTGLRARTHVWACVYAKACVRAKLAAHDMSVCVHPYVNMHKIWVFALACVCKHMQVTLYASILLASTIAAAHRQGHLSTCTACVRTHISKRWQKLQYSMLLLLLHLMQTRAHHIQATKETTHAFCVAVSGAVSQDPLVDSAVHLSAHGNHAPSAMLLPS